MQNSKTYLQGVYFLTHGKTKHFALKRNQFWGLAALTGFFITWFFISFVWILVNENSKNHLQIQLKTIRNQIFMDQVAKDDLFAKVYENITPIDTSFRQSGKSFNLDDIKRPIEEDSNQSKTMVKVSAPSFENQDTLKIPEEQTLAKAINKIDKLIHEEKARVVIKYINQSFGAKNLNLNFRIYNEKRPQRITGYMWVQLHFKSPDSTSTRFLYPPELVNTQQEIPPNLNQAKQFSIKNFSKYSLNIPLELPKESLKGVAIIIANRSGEILLKKEHKIFSSSFPSS